MTRINVPSLRKVHVLGLCGIVVAVAVLLVTSSNAAPKSDKKVEGGGSTAYIEITSTPPKDLPSRDVSQEELAKFAWQELLALSWKSAIEGDENPQGKRGMPDPSWSYGTPGPYPTLLVWQTYAQTTELRPNGPLTIPFDQLGIPKYSYQKPIVAGEPDAEFDLWNNLDEDNEIGSCDLYGQFAEQPDPKNLFLYQVKVNADEYEYVRTQFGPTQYLPINGKPNGPTGALYEAQNQVVQNIKNPPFSYYPGAPTGPTATCDCGAKENAICLPCGGADNGNGGTYEGAIEVKSAWRKLLPNENPDLYYTTVAQYYNLNAQGELAYYNDTFALMGIHIIHKTQNFPDFVFATFEHVGVADTGVEYVLLDNNGAQTGSPVPVKRQLGQTNRDENHPVPPELDEVTQKVHAQLKALNPDVIWQNYRLTGVQGQVVDCPIIGSPPKGKAATKGCILQQNPITCTDLDPNYFMANLVIESDPFLNNFSGPGFGSNPFGNCRNVVYDNKTYDHGGCKGCHGVAQTAFGTDFSFLLDFGNNKPSIQPATINYTPPPPPSVTEQAKPVRLKNYLPGVKRP